MSINNQEPLRRALGAELRDLADEEPFEADPLPVEIDPVPIWLLDVDGVINAMDRTAKVWPEYTQLEARGYLLHYAPELVQTIALWHATRKVEVWWLTTWRHHANTHFAELWGLPQLTVANTNREYSVRDSWWKLPVAQRVARQTGRRIVWTDDDLRMDAGAKQWVASRKNQVLGISPNPLYGLTPQHLDRIQAWL